MIVYHAKLEVGLDHGAFRSEFHRIIIVLWCKACIARNLHPAAAQAFLLGEGGV